MGNRIRIRVKKIIVHKEANFDLWEKGIHGGWEALGICLYQGGLATLVITTYCGIVNTLLVRLHSF